MPLAWPSRVLSTVPASPMAEPSSVITEGQDTLAAGGEGPETGQESCQDQGGHSAGHRPLVPALPSGSGGPLSARDLFLELLKR